MNVDVTLKINAGNHKAYNKIWAKWITGVDSSQSGCYGLQGGFAKIPYSKSDEKILTGSIPEGTLIIVYAKGGTWKNHTSAYVLLKAHAGATFFRQAGYQTFTGENFELIAHSGEQYTEAEEEKIIAQYPDLAQYTEKQFPIFYRLKGELK